MGDPCEGAFHDVYSYLDQELTWFRSWKLRRHLKACDGCEDAYSFEERLRLVVRSRLREDIPPDLLARLQQAIENERLR